MALEIYTNGDMAFMETILTGMGHVYNDGFLGQIFAMALLANALVSLLKFVNDSRSGFLTSFWQAIILYLVMFSATTKITLTKIGEGTRPIAGDFPVGVVAPAYFISMIGSKIAERFRDNIVVIDAGWGNTSNTAILEYGLSPLEALMKIRSENFAGAFEKSDLLSDIANPDGGSSGLGRAIGTYYSYCVEKAVKLSQLDPTGIPYLRRISGAKVNSDYWRSLLIDEPWPLTYDLDGQIKSGTCTTAHEDIGLALKKRAEELAQAKIFDFSHDRSDLTAAEEFSRMKDFYQKIDPNTGADAISKLSTNMYTALMAEGACKDSVLMGPEFVQACTAQWDAIQNRRVQEASKADSFLEMLSPMVTFIEGFVYVISPFMILLVLFTGSSGLKMMGKYLTALLWVTLIPICQVAVDVYLNTYFNRFLYSLNQDGAGTSLVSIQAQESVWTELESFVAFAGTAQAMVPALAMFIIFAGVHTLQGMGAGMASGAAIDGSKLHSNKAVSIKDGSYGYGQTNVVEARNEYGTQVGGEQIRAHKSNVDASASDFGLQVSSKDAWTQKVSASESYTTSLQASTGTQAAKSFGETFGKTDQYVLSEGMAAGASKSASKTLSFADQLQKDYGFSQQTAERLSQTIQGSMSAGISTPQALSKIFKAGAEVGMSGQDVDAFDRASSMTEKHAETAAAINKLDKMIDSKYAAQNQNSDTASLSENYTDNDMKYFAASSAYGAQVAKQEAIEKAAASAVDMKASLGKYIADAGVTQSSMRGVLNNAGFDEFRSNSLEAVTGKSLSDLRSMSDKELNNTLSTLTNDKKFGEQAKSDLDLLGISKNSEGNWSIKSDKEFEANVAGFNDVKEYETRTHFNRDGGASERQELLQSAITGIEKVRSGISAQHSKETMQAASDVYSRMAKDTTGSMQGTDGNGVHGAMNSLSKQYSEEANSLIDVDTGYDKFLANAGLKEITETGAKVNAIQLDSDQQLRLMEENTAGATDNINSNGQRIVSNFNQAKGSFTSVIDSQIRGVSSIEGLDSMSKEDRIAAILGQINTEDKEFTAKSDANAESIDEFKSNVVQAVREGDSEGVMPDSDHQDKSADRLYGETIVDYKANEVLQAKEIAASLTQLESAKMEFNSIEAKEAFDELSADQVAKYNDYVTGKSDASLDEIVSMFKENSSDFVNNSDFASDVKNLRETFVHHKETENEILEEGGQKALNKAYLGAAHLETLINETDSQSVEKGVVDVSQLSAADEIELFGHKVKKALSF
ncbi:conjugal transfer protein TraG N-terminal domain-containing protein [Vibrio parahaemolyticus]|nr:conjugal transfer protein TraG N-terminal domain-containing protein [Vibrio parahaemolyticus]